MDDSTEKPPPDSENPYSTPSSAWRADVETDSKRRGASRCLAAFATSVALWLGGLVLSDRNSARAAFLLFALAGVAAVVSFGASARFVVVAGKSKAVSPFLISVVAIFGGLGGLFMAAIGFFAAVLTSSDAQSIP